MPTPAPRRSAMTPALVVLVLTLLLGIQPLTTDLYLPALPTIARDFGAAASATRQTLAALIICFMMMATACAVSIVLGNSMNGTVYPLTLGVGAFGIVVAATAWTLVQRHGEVRALPASGQPT